MQRKRKKKLNTVIESGIKQIKKLRKRLPALTLDPNALLKETTHRLKNVLTIAEAKAPKQVALIKRIKDAASLRVDSVKTRCGKLSGAKQGSNAQ